MKSDEPVRPPFLGAMDVVTTPLNDVWTPEPHTAAARLSRSAGLARVAAPAQRVQSGHQRLAGHFGVSIRPGATSTEISEFVAMNKAIVSKSVNTLISRELIVPADGARGSRHLYLTRAGARHARSHEAALAAGPGDRARRPQHRRDRPVERPAAPTARPRRRSCRSPPRCRSPARCRSRTDQSAKAIARSGSQLRTLIGGEITVEIEFGRAGSDLSRREVGTPFVRRHHDVGAPVGRIGSRRRDRDCRSSTRATTWLGSRRRNSASSRCEGRAVPAASASTE